MSPRTVAPGAPCGRSQRPGPGRGRRIRSGPVPGTAGLGRGDAAGRSRHVVRRVVAGSVVIGLLVAAPLGAVLGLVTGGLPARRAAAIEPVDALRGGT